jgi:hypothetical protein
MHKAITATTQRSANLQWLASAAASFVAFTGTPILNHKPMQLAGWLSLILPFAVEPRNIWTSMGTIVAQPVRLPIEARVVLHDMSLALRNDATYNTLLQSLRSASGLPGGFLVLFRFLCDKFVYPAYPDLVRRALAQPSNVPARRPGGQRVAVVVYGQADVLTVANALVAAGVTQARDIFCMGIRGAKPRARTPSAKKARTDDAPDVGTSDDGAINFTDQAVDEGGRDYRVVIIPSRMSAGYSLSRCEHLISFPYPSNEANRTQMRMRLPRVDQLATTLTYTYVVGEILLRMHERAGHSQSLAECMHLLLA